MTPKHYAVVEIVNGELFAVHIKNNLDAAEQSAAKLAIEASCLDPISEGVVDILDNLSLNGYVALGESIDRGTAIYVCPVEEKEIE